MEAKVSDVMIQFDYVIAGAGLAGLSLAKSLDSAGKFGRGCLIEPRLYFQRDHIWCFWNKAPLALTPPLRKSWNRWKVSYRGRTRICTSKRYPYCCVFAEDYYAEALASIEKSRNLELLLGEAISQIEYSTNAIRLRTDKCTIQTGLLFDSRPPEVNSTVFRQEFAGFIVEAENAVFDPTCVTLMDFQEVKVRDGFHFFYVLPFSEKSALVESVYVGLGGLGEDTHREHVVSYLKSEFALTAFRETHRENGLIPMHPVRAGRPEPRHYLIGARGGMVRTSTGYAFSTIHRYSDEMAETLESVESARAVYPEPPEMYSAKSKLLDAVLLGYMRQKPWEGPLLLSSLFFGVETGVLVRFLTDTSSVADDASIFAAMPRKLELSAMMAKDWLF